MSRFATLPKPKETDVAAAALAALAPQWAEHWAEVPSLSGRVDFVGRDADGALHAVECKVGPSLALAGQALARIHERAFASVLVVFASLGPRWRDNTGGADLVRIGLEVGFGVGVVFGESERPRFLLELAPRPLSVEPGPRDLVARALNDIHREIAGDAGGQSSRYWTLWKQGVHELERAVAATPGINVATLRHRLGGTNTLYWQNHTAQIRKMAEASKKVRAEFNGREYAYFPVEVPNA